MSKRRSSKKHSGETLVFPKSDNQADYIDAIKDSVITFCSGPAGSGKSYITAGLACQMLKSGEISRILITRPLVTVGKSMGFLPGDLAEKINPFNEVMEEHFIEFLGKEDYVNCKRNGSIKIMPLEILRGATFKDTFMVLDEAQNFTFEQIRMFLTRVGHGSKVVVNGDMDQTDLDGQRGAVSGMSMCIKKLWKVEQVEICSLTHEDIQRHSIIAPVLRALDQ